MRIDSDKLKSLRKAKHWSQEELATVCGLTTRTIQRIERTGKVSTESLKALAAAFDIDTEALLLNERQIDKKQTSVLPIVKRCFQQYSDFDGTATRSQYWLFFAFCFVCMAVATIIEQKLAYIVGLIILLPLVAVGARRLHDAGHSGWWQLLSLVPLGILLVFYMLSLESKLEQKTTV